jgi:ferredoxin
MAKEKKEKIKALSEKSYKITQEHEKCIGCGACVASCSSNWKLGTDGKAKPIKTKINEKELACNKEAENVCPVQCIHIK